MKPVVERIIDKNGGETTRFHATGQMFLFAMEKAKAPGEGDGELAKRAGIPSGSPRKWAQKYGSLYLEWLDEFVEATHFSRQAEVLEAVGMVNATQGDHKFWKDMAKKHGVISEETKDIRVTINTDFNVILAQGDLADARRRILQEVRGLGNEGEPGVVDITPSEDTSSPESTGGGAGNLQGRPMALPTPLGRNRG